MGRRSMIIDSRTPYAMIENKIVKEGISSYEIATYVCLCVHANRKDEAWPSYPTIGKEAGMSARHAARAVNTLVEKGWLKKKVEKGRRTVYTIIGIPMTDSPGCIDSQSRVPMTDSLPNNNHMNNNNEQYHSIQDAFESKYGQFENYGKEGKAIHGIIKKGNLLREGDIARMIEVFYGLTQGRDKFWVSQPFLPSSLNSLWARVKVQAEDKSRESPATDRYLRGRFK